MSRYYTDPNGNRYPLTEARYDMDFSVYKSDRRKAEIGDPRNCLLARGVRRHRAVLDVFFGAGHDAYVVFKGTPDEPAHAVHFLLRTKARRIIDAFDKDRTAKTQRITLLAPPPSWTLEGRRKNNARRRAEIKAGSPVKKRSKPVIKRVQRLGGVAYRPRPTISRGGSVVAPQEQTA